jgi:hypothetical protein
MATYTASAAQTGAQPKGLRVGLSGVASQYDATGVSLSIASVFNMVKIPAGARVLFMSYGTTNTGDGTVQIGDSVNGTRYKSALTLSAGLATIVTTTFSNYKYSADDTIILRVSLSSASTLGGTFFLNCIYGMDTD